MSKNGQKSGALIRPDFLLQSNEDGSPSNLSIYTVTAKLGKGVFGFEWTTTIWVTEWIASLRGAIGSNDEMIHRRQGYGGRVVRMFVAKRILSKFTKPDFERTKKIGNENFLRLDPFSHQASRLTRLKAPTVST
jgi:hypothetical protein